MYIIQPVKVWSVLFRDGAELLVFIVPRVAPQGAIAKWAGYRVTGEARFGGFRCVRLRLRLKHRHLTNCQDCPYSVRAVLPGACLAFSRS